MKPRKVNGFETLNGESNVVALKQKVGDLVHYQLEDLNKVDREEEIDDGDMWGNMDDEITFDDDEFVESGEVSERQVKEDILEHEDIKPTEEEPVLEETSTVEVPKNGLVHEFDDFEDEIARGMTAAARSLETTPSQIEEQPEEIKQNTTEGVQQDESNENEELQETSANEHSEQLESAENQDVPQIERNEEKIQTVESNEINQAAKQAEQSENFVEAAEEKEDTHLANTQEIQDQIPDQDPVEFERVKPTTDLNLSQYNEDSEEVENLSNNSHRVIDNTALNGGDHYTELTKTISSLTNQLEQVTQERDDIQSSYDNLLSKLSSMKTIFSNMKQSELELVEKSELVETLTRENQQLKSQLEQINRDKSEEDGLISQLRESNNDLNSECERLSDSLTKSRREYTATIEELSDEKYNFENQNNKLSKKVNELKSELNELNILQNELNLENKSKATTIEELKQTSLQKDQELEESNKNIEVLKKVILESQENSDKAISDLKQEIESLNEKVSTVEGENSKLSNDISENKQEIDNLTTQLKEIDELKADINTKQLLIGKLRHEAIILNEHLTKALSIIKQGDGSNTTVDRELISNVVLSFLQFPRGDTKKFEALQLISALLEWNPDQKVIAGLQQTKSGNGGGRTDRNGGTDGQSQRQSFVSLWTDFLEKESMGKTKASPKKPKKEPEVIDLEDDDEAMFTDEDDDDDLVEIKPSTPKRKAPTPKKTTPKKATPKKASSPNKTKVEPTASGGSVSGPTADQVLASIPDAELPEVNELEKINFIALAAAKKANASDTPSSVMDIPEAQPNCLSGLTIVFTGQLPNLDRGASESLAKRYGAKVTKSISGKTSLVVLGQDAGPSKVKKIKQLRIKSIDEDGFVELLKRMPLEGGSGEAAQKAKLKREEEERKVIEDAEKEAKLEAEEEEKQRKKLAAAAAVASASASASGSRAPPPPSQPIISPKDKLWTDKHAPTSINQLCGNKGQIAKLRHWLDNWFEYQKQGFTKNAKEGGNMRAALISGPPGIGKTTSAHLIAKELGYDVLEKNASDVRSKSLLNATVKSILNNTSVVGFFKQREDQALSDNSKKICLIMDEVDGMSSGDHGGAGALSQFCRITNMPMILICNDKSLPKMKTFDRVCFDLPFRRPSEAEVKSRLMTIALREGIKLDPNIIGQLVQATSNDMRQMINLMSQVSKTQKAIGNASLEEINQGWKKHVILKPFDIAGKLLSSGIWTSPRQNLNEKLDLYFNDIDFAPLMIQENYLMTRPRLGGSHIKHVAQAADDISQSDLINSLIRSSEQQWSLLPFHGLMSSVRPSFEVAGSLTDRLAFSSWLGQNSKQMKYQRILQELQYHTRIKTSTTKQELRLDYLTPLWNKLNNHLEDGYGIDETIEIMDDYFLTKEDFDNIGELLKQDVKLTSSEKSNFTRTYNNGMHPTVIYKTGNSVLNSRRGAAAKVDYEDVVDDDMEDVPDEEEDSDKIDTKKDKLIKAGRGNAKPKAKPKAKAPAKKKRKS
ncbi:Replication factor C subunit 1 [Spathaspora sp. JA1]|nr:Replication factor C subunit 1 [Spathaspora sp. JA1]